MKPSPFRQERRYTSSIRCQSIPTVDSTPTQKRKWNYIDLFLPHCAIITSAVRVAKVAAKSPAAHTRPSPMASPTRTQIPLMVLLAKTTWENPRRTASNILRDNQGDQMGLASKKSRTIRHSPANCSTTWLAFMFDDDGDAMSSSSCPAPPSSWGTIEKLA